MSQKNHYTGLTDAEVLESRKKTESTYSLRRKKNHGGNAFLKSSAPRSLSFL